MTDIEISELILQEFRVKSLGTTSQYLEIHEPIYENAVLKIDRIDREKGDNLIIAYLPVKDEYFSFAIYINSASKNIIAFDTESRNIVSAIFTSEIRTGSELKSLTKLDCKYSWNKGDQKPNRKSIYKNSGIQFCPNTEPDEFEDKLEKLLTFLEKDSEGILSLSKNAKGNIQVIMDFHNGNQFLGDMDLEADIIKRISALNLRINFQITAWGNKFK